MARHKWIQKAIRRPGAFSRKASAAGMSVQAYARRVLRPDSKADLRTKRQASLALTLSRLRRRSRGWAARRR